MDRWPRWRGGGGILLNPEQPTGGTDDDPDEQDEDEPSESDRDPPLWDRQPHSPGPGRTEPRRPRRWPRPVIV
jgi:hypothetical protein